MSLAPLQPITPRLACDTCGCVSLQLDPRDSTLFCPNHDGWLDANQVAGLPTTLTLTWDAAPVDSYEVVVGRPTPAVGSAVRLAGSEPRGWVYTGDDYRWMALFPEVVEEQGPADDADETFLDQGPPGPWLLRRPGLPSHALLDPPCAICRQPVPGVATFGLDAVHPACEGLRVLRRLAVDVAHARALLARVGPAAEPDLIDAQGAVAAALVALGAAPASSQ